VYSLSQTKQDFESYTFFLIKGINEQGKEKFMVEPFPKELKKKIRLKEFENE